MVVITHRIAGITFRTESDIPIPHLQQDPFKQFQVSDAEPDVRYRIHQLDLDSFTLPPFSENEIRCISVMAGFKQHWREHSVFRSPEVRTRLQACLNQPEKVNIDINWNGLYIRDFVRNEFDLFYPPERKELFAGPFIVAGFRNWLSTFLTNFSAIMIHSAGVTRNSNAALFLAPDEGGKTTVARCANEALILNDDHIILRQQDNVFVAHGTPLGPITGGPQQARLGSFFLLEQASHFELTPIKPRDVLHFLWNEHAHHWRFLPKYLKIRAFDILYDACHQVPVYRMCFPENYVDWEAIDTAMAK